MKTEFIRIRRGIWFVVIYLFAVALSAGVFVWAKSRQKKYLPSLSRKQSDENRGQSDHSVSVLPAIYGFRPGMRLNYSFSLSQHASVSAVQEEPAQSTIATLVMGHGAIRINGDLRIAVFSIEKDTCWCIADFSDVDGKESKSDVFDVSELTKPLVFVVSLRGELGLIYSPRGLSVAAVRFWQSVLPLLFFRLPQHAETTWRTSYSDLIGTYEAEHVLAGQGLVNVKKVSYRLSNGDGVPRLEVGQLGTLSMRNLQHGQVFLLDLVNAVVSRVTIKESCDLTLFQKLKVSGDKKGDVWLQRIELVNQGDLERTITKSFGIRGISSLAESARRYRVDEVISEKEVSRILIQTDGGVAQIIEACKTLSSTEDKQRNQLFGELVSAIRVQPGAVSEISKKILECRDDRRLRKWLLDSLAYAGSEASCTALATFVRGDVPGLKSQAVMACGFVVHPTQILVEAVSETIKKRQDLDPITAQTALSVAGAFVSRLANDLVSRDALVAILRALGPTIDDERLLKAYFSAWSNTQLLEAKERILERTSSAGSDSLWNSAIFALENLRNQNAREALILFAADTSRSSALRDRAIRALANQELLPEDQVTRLISNRLTTSVMDWATTRSALLYLDRAARGADAEALELLKKTANGHSNDRVRDLAMHLVSEISVDLSSQ